MARPRKWGLFKKKASPDDAFQDAVSEVDCLAEEMREWAGGMEGTNLEHTAKYEELETAAECLEDISSGLQEIESLDLLGNDPLVYSEWKKRRLSRDHRRSNVILILEALEDLIDGLIGDEEDDDIYSSLDDMRGILSEKREELEMVEFPGMFG